MYRHPTSCTCPQGLLSHLCCNCDQGTSAPTSICALWFLYVIWQCNTGGSGGHLQPPWSSVEEGIVALGRDRQTKLCHELNVDKPPDVCGVEVGEFGPQVCVSVTHLWEVASGVDKVGNHGVGRLCLVDGVEGLPQLVVALGVSSYVCQHLVSIIASPSSLTVTLH